VHEQVNDWTRQQQQVWQRAQDVRAVFFPEEERRDG
jgi:uncharacterized membrane protein